MLFEILIAETTDFHWHRLGQLARKITHVHARAAVNVRRIFVSEEENFHAGRVEQGSNLLSMEFARRSERRSNFSLSVKAPALRPDAGLCRLYCRKAGR